MGHSHFLVLPKTEKWKLVLDLIDGGARVEEIVAATIDAAERQLKRATSHQALIEAVALIRDLAAATDGEGLRSALDGIGLRLTDAPTAIELAVAVSEKLERRTESTATLPDFAEITRRTAVSTLLRYLNESMRERSNGEATARHALKELSSPSKFAKLMESYFGSVATATVMYYLSRELPCRVGGGRRFVDLDALDSFSMELSSHCMAAARGRAVLPTGSADLQLPSIRKDKDSGTKEYASSAMNAVLERLRKSSAAA